MFYLDTSVLVSALTNEADTALSQDWLAKQETSELTISDWTVTEFASAFVEKGSNRRARP
jgi:predicted nucleic acid-binding protein